MAELRRLRDRAGHTAEEVAKILGWHRTKVIRLEQGQSRVMPKDMPPLLHLYEATESERESLAALHRQSRLKGWWSAYGDVLPDDYVGFEAEATSISSFESLYVPGLLQTEEYVRAIVRAGRGTADQDETDRVVAARLGPPL
ncbi:helix-turn-helix domain-containing protein [Micromonospora sp. NBC_01392]